MPIAFSVKFAVIKNASTDMLAFFTILLNSYFAGSSATGAVGAVGVVGIVVVGTTNSSFPNIFDPEAWLPLKLKLESKIKAIKIPPNVQVLLSKKSVVF